MPLQFRRGTNAERLTITPAVGEPIWTTNTNLLYVGDGTTVGGIRIELPLPTTATFATLTVTNLHFSGDPVGVNQTTAWTGTVAWSEIGSKPNGGLYTTSTVEFNQLSVTGSTIASTQSSILVNASGSTVYEDPHSTGYLVWGINDAGASARLVTDTYAGASSTVASVWTGRKARGTAAAPSAVQNGDLILRLAGTGFGTTQFATTSSGYLEVVARENFTDGARGTQINLATTNVGTNTTNNSLRVASDGTTITAPQASATESVLTVNKTGLTTYPAPVNVDGYDIWAIREGESARGVLDSYGTGVQSNWQGRRARGTAAAPSAVQDEDVLASFRGNGYGATGYAQTSTAYINISAAENFTDTERGTRIAFYGTEVGQSQSSLISTMRPESVYVYTTASTGGMVTVQGTFPNFTYPGPGNDVMVHGVAKPGTTARITLDAFGADDPSYSIYGSFTGRRAQGTADAPSNTLAGDILTGIRGFAYGTSGFLNTSSGGINITANENITDSAGGGKMTFFVQQNGSVSTATQTTIATIDQTGLTINTGGITATTYTVSGSGKLYQSGGALILTNNGSVNLVDTSGGSQVNVYGGGAAIQTTDGTLNATAGSSGLLGWTGSNGFQTNKITFSGDSSVQTTAWTGTVVWNNVTNKPNNGLYTTSTVQFAGITDTGPLSVSGFSSLNGGATISAATVTNNLTAGATTVQSLVVTTGTRVNQVISAGGFVLDSNGQALIAVSSTQTPALVISNTTAGLLPRAYIRGFGQNTPGGTATTQPQTALALESSRGTAAAPTATGNGDTLGTVQFSGYDGANWLYNQTTAGVPTLSPGSLIFTASETFANNGTTTTNAGSQFAVRTQPVGTQLNSTSRRLWMVQSWTAGSTATNSPPIMGLGFGQGTGDAAIPTLTPAGGVGSFGTGSGRTNFSFNACQQFVFGVTNSDTAPDNATLTATNVVNFITSRRNSFAGRRDPLLVNDNIFVIQGLVQPAANGAGNGNINSLLTFTMTENASSTARGSRFVVQTVTSGTTTLSTRLSLDDRINAYRSDNHSFTSANTTWTPLSFTTSTWNSSIDSQVFGNGAGTVNMLTMNTTLNEHRNTSHIFKDRSNTFTALNMTTSTAVFTAIPVVPNYTAAQANAITGQIGATIAISDSAGGGNPNGMLAFWDTTNARWSYIHDNSAV